MNVAFFLARHFYKTPGSGKRISGTTLHIATAGVAAGLAVMIISVCVVLGFKNEIRSKVIGFGAHIEKGRYQIVQIHRQADRLSEQRHLCLKIAQSKFLPVKIGKVHLPRAVYFQIGNIIAPAVAQYGFQPEAGELVKTQPLKMQV